MKTLTTLIAFAVVAFPAWAQEPAKADNADKEKAAAPAGRYQLKTRSNFTLPPGTRAPFIPIGWVRKDGVVVVAPQVSSIDESAFRVTSILLGNPALAVINGRSYEEGQFLRLPRGSQARIKVYRITDGQVWLQADDKLWSTPLKRPELNERRMEELPLLNDEREVVPTAPPPAGAPAAPAAPAAPMTPGTRR